MGKPREFTTLPARAIADSRLTGLDLRVLAAIAIHDGMSLVKGNGPGCYAKLTTLATLVRTDVSNFSKSVSRLVAFGYVVREPQQMDKRRYTLRVIYGDDDSWRVDQQSAPEKLGEETNDRPEIVGGAANFPAEIVGDADNENGSISKENGEHYISLKEELDFDESKELNSSEEARFAQGETRVEDFSDQISQLLGLRKNGAEAPAARRSIDRELGITGRAFACQAPDAQLAIFERAFNRIGRDASALDHAEGLRWGNWLLAMWSEHHGEPLGHRAERILNEWESRPPDVPIDQLRRWAREIILTNRCNTQGELADAAGMPAGVLSNFKNGKNLPDRYRTGLQAACDRFLPLHEWEAAA